MLMQKFIPHFSLAIKTSIHTIIPFSFSVLRPTEMDLVHTLLLAKACFHAVCLARACAAAVVVCLVRLHSDLDRVRLIGNRLVEQLVAEVFGDAGCGLGNILTLLVLGRCGRRILDGRLGCCSCKSGICRMLFLQVVLH